MIAFWMVMGLLVICIAVIVICARQVHPEYEYGTFECGRARRHRKTGVVEFVIWKAGEQGHVEDIWWQSDRSWWNTFVADKL